MKVTFLLIYILMTCSASCQWLKAKGKVIVNSQSEEVLLRGIGPGGWQIMEGYMMKTSGFAGSQHEIKNNLVALMGEENTEIFFNKWRTNHFTKRDVDSLAAWGFNSIRIPLHYNLFTLPIEDEPTEGTHTWIETGFNLIDDVLKWCAPYNMYVILDLHAAPGGQGTGSEINDYDPTKSSLWEDHSDDPGGSQRNKDKTIALWTRIADRYKDNEWIGGYDLINEPHFNLPGGTELRDLYVDITEGIRTVDSNHILFIEGNWYANDYTGLLPPWDTNLVYSFHKYWNFNTATVLDWVLLIRTQYDVPLWMGESGENSNTWFTDAVRLFEDNGIGWAWWAMRKIGDIDSPYAIDINPGYQRILDYWNPEVNAPQPSKQEAFEAMMQLAENLLIENSQFRKDVPDALIRQPHTDETIPYAKQEIPGVIFLSDFDLGKNEFAYLDEDVADYNNSSGSFQAWNSGWSYRNDGVDIETNVDDVNSNGYHIGFTNDGEWTKYTVEITESGIYRADIRLASDQSNIKFHFELNDQSITPLQTLSTTGGWSSFVTHSIDNINIEAGRQELKIHFDQGAINMSSIEFKKVESSEDLPFIALTAKMTSDPYSIELVTNKAVQAASLMGSESFLEVKNNGLPIVVNEVKMSNDRTVLITLEDPVLFSDIITITLNDFMILSTDNKSLVAFSDFFVINNLPERYVLPGKIEAENYEDQRGLGTEETTDAGGGSNIGWTDAGDYADYKIFVREDREFVLSLRIASESQSGRIGFYLVDENTTETELLIMSIPVTGGWQSWETIWEYIYIPAGVHTLRMKVLTSGFNMNWFSAAQSITLGVTSLLEDLVSVYPNPTTGLIKISKSEYSSFIILSMDGSKTISGSIPNNNMIDLGHLVSGLYILNLINEQSGKISSHHLIISQ
tara:strand:- start:1843 stop:4563 length:2721 start_codon:yes stop_codon:yes gene_type:complete